MYPELMEAVNEGHLDDLRADYRAATAKGGSRTEETGLQKAMPHVDAGRRPLTISVEGVWRGLTARLYRTVEDPRTALASAARTTVHVFDLDPSATVTPLRGRPDEAGSLRPSPRWLNVPLASMNDDGCTQRTA